MSASLAATLALVLAATASAQDQPAPNIFQGKWSGQQQAAFGAASATDPNSLECIPNGGIITSKARARALVCAKERERARTPQRSPGPLTLPPSLARSPSR
jgi:hypothetical protein